MDEVLRGGPPAGFPCARPEAARLPHVVRVTCYNPRLPVPLALADPLPEFVLSAETGALMVLGSCTEISDPPVL
jgi:hypothetical protein